MKINDRLTLGWVLHNILYRIYVYKISMTQCICSNVSARDIGQILAQSHRHQKIMIKNSDLTQLLNYTVSTGSPPDLRYQTYPVTSVVTRVDTREVTIIFIFCERHLSPMLTSPLQVQRGCPWCVGCIQLCTICVTNGSWKWHQSSWGIVQFNAVKQISLSAFHRLHGKIDYAHCCVVWLVSKHLAEVLVRHTCKKNWMIVY